jgi:glycosyltransferase involved in cell wall biosynthesis
VLDLKILQVVPCLEPSWGGSARVAKEISSELSKRGHEVVIYTSKIGENLKFQDMKKVNIHFLSTVSPFVSKQTKFFVTPELNRLLERDVRHYDVIHLHEYRTYQNMVVHKYANKFQVPYILHAHGGLLRSPKKLLKLVYDNFFGLSLLSDASAVIALSPVEARQYRTLRVSNEKIHIIPNGIDFSDFVNLPPKGLFRKKFNITERKRIVLFVGRINRDKGIDFLVSAFAHLIGTNQSEDALLVIAGPDDGYLSTAKRLVRHYGIEDHTLFTGPLLGIQKVEAYVDASIVACLDSLEEVVFLLVPLESVACKTPVIVTKSNYISTYVEEGKFGELIRYGRVVELSNLLKRMMNNEAQRAEMGSNGRKYVFRNFRWADKIDVLEEIYEDIIKRKAKYTY